MTRRRPLTHIGEKFTPADIVAKVAGNDQIRIDRLAKERETDLAWKDHKGKGNGESQVDISNPALAEALKNAGITSEESNQ